MGFFNLLFPLEILRSELFPTFHNKRRKRDHVRIKFPGGECNRYNCHVTAASFSILVSLTCVQPLAKYIARALLSW